MKDPFANNIITDLGSILGYGLSSVVNLLDVKSIIIGGVIAGFGKPLYSAIHNAVVERVMKPFKEKIQIIPALLKNEAGIKGASSLVFYSSLPDEFSNE